MRTVRYGGKKGCRLELVDGDEFVVVRTRGKEPIRRAPLSEPARRRLADFRRVLSFPQVGVEVLRTDAASGARSRRDAVRAALKKEPAVCFAGRVLVDRETRRPHVYTENFFLKLVDDASDRALKPLLAAYKLKLKRKLAFATNAYFLEAPEDTGQDVFEIAKDLLERPEVELCHPEIISERAKRGVFPGQWHLAKQRIGARTIDAHAHVEAAWELSRGEGTIVAIVDDGVDVDHEEFRSSAKITAPRDVTFDDDDPRPGEGDDHGTACAGVAVADGRFGASGVAPGARLMPIRLVSYLGSMDEAEAFRWAADHGADVISCSWGPFDGAWFDPNDPLHRRFQPIPDHTRLAIEYAATQGRNGRGCVVLFAAGNGDESVDLDGYASHPKVIAVAACNDAGKKSRYSDFGNAVWCTFPSNDVVGNHFGIFTTDRRGVAGYNVGLAELGDVDGDYTNDFGGTSSACPGAAGVAALVLSRNPELRAEEVRDILKRSCDRIDPSGGGWNAEGRSPKYGWGRLNARRAVELAAPAAPPSGAVTVIRATTAAVPIPDLGTARLTTEVADDRVIDALSVRVELEHTWIGDLVVKLVPPDGTGAAVVLHDRLGGSTKNLRKTYAADAVPGLAALVGRSPKGTWTLEASDRAKADVGVLRKLELTLTLGAPTRRAPRRGAASKRKATKRSSAKRSTGRRTTSRVGAAPSTARRAAKAARNAGPTTARRTSARRRRRTTAGGARRRRPAKV